MSGGELQRGKNLNWEGVIEFLQEHSQSNRAEMEALLRERQLLYGTVGALEKEVQEQRQLNLDLMDRISKLESFIGKKDAKRRHSNQLRSHKRNHSDAAYQQTVPTPPERHNNTYDASIVPEHELEESSAENAQRSKLFQQSREDYKAKRATYSQRRHTKNSNSLGSGLQDSPFGHRHEDLQGDFQMRQPDGRISLPEEAGAACATLPPPP